MHNTKTIMAANDRQTNILEPIPIIPSHLFTTSFTYSKVLFVLPNKYSPEIYQPPNLTLQFYGQQGHHRDYARMKRTKTINVT